MGDVGRVVGGVLVGCMVVALGLAWGGGGSGVLLARWLVRLSLACWIGAGGLALVGRVRRRDTAGGRWSLGLFLASLPLFALSALLEWLYAL